MIKVNSAKAAADIVRGIGETIRNADFRGMIGQSWVPRLAQIHQGYFNRSAGPSGQRWEEWHWTDPNVMQHPTLYVSGKLRGSLTVGGASNVSRPSAHGLVWGTSVPYAKIHQEGARIVTGRALVSRDGRFYLPAGSVLNIPRREFLGLSDEAVGFFVDSTADFLIRLIEES